MTTKQIYIGVIGSLGTLSEIRFAGMNKIPVIGLHSWEIDPAANNNTRLLTVRAETPAEAAEWVKQYLG